MNPVLEYKNVTIRYQGKSDDTVSSVSFHVHPDERVALFGLNGSGKTSMLLAAAGLVPFSGTICVDGTAVAKKTIQDVREKIGFLFNIPEDQILFPRVLDDVAYGLMRKGCRVVEAHSKSLEILEALGLAHIAHASPFQLSHGQRQRVALAGALVTSPKVIMLDEPSSALDPPGKFALSKTLGTIKSSILIATHDFDFASNTCSRFLIVYKGKLRECSGCNEAKDILLQECTGSLPGKVPH